MVWNFSPPVYKYCHYCCLPPTGPTSHSVPTLANLPASVLLGNTHQHSNRCHLATDCRLQHTRQNKNSVQRENNTQGGPCDRRPLTCRHRVGKRGSRLCINLSPHCAQACCRNALKPHYTLWEVPPLPQDTSFPTQNLYVRQAWFFRHRNKHQQASVTLWHPWDFRGNHVVYLFPYCKYTFWGIFQ